MMEYTLHKILALIGLCILLFISTGIGLARGQKSIGKIGAKEAVSRQRARVAASRAPAKLYTFTGPDGDFTIQFPSKPIREDDALGLIGVIRRYSSTTDTYYFGINYQDVGPDASNLKPTHEETVASLLQERGHKVVSIRRLSRNTTQMELWSPSQTPNKFLHRIERTIFIHDRMYTLGCGLRIAEQEVDKTVCRRFFNSFRVIGIPQ